MEQNKNRLPWIIGGIIVVLCLGITALGFGAHYLYQNYFQDGFSVALDGGSDEGDFYFPDENAPTATPWNPSLPAPDPALSDLFDTVWTTRELLQENFLIQPVEDTQLAEGAITGLTTYLEEMDVSLDDIKLPADAPTAEDTAARANTPEPIFDAMLPFWELWNKLAYATLPDEVTDVTLMRKANEGMVSGLGDPYTNYFDPDLSEQYTSSLVGEYEGIGAWVDVDGEFLTIVSAIRDTPAEEAGLQPGDAIIAVDGKDMTGVDPNVVLTQVLGPAGSKVVLTIQRENEAEPFDVEIVRKKISIPYIESEMLDGDIAYLHLQRFYDGAGQDIRAELESLLDQNPKGLIFDMRGDPGGYLHTAVNITSEFIDDGVVLYEEFSDGSRKDYPVLTSKGIALDIPLVVLVNEGTASAAEIFAGAIQDYGRGTIVGQTTFGKGVVQLPITLPDGEGLVSITIARWLTPNGITIHEIGIEPDVAVEYTQEQYDAGIDPQLDKAIEILTTGE